MLVRKKAQNFFQIEQKMLNRFQKCSQMKIAPCEALYYLAWPCFTSSGLVWPFMVLMAFYGLLRQNIDLIGLVSSFFTVIDLNSFRLVSLVRTKPIILQI